jgi:arrestin-related trafficking adapter 3/6
MSHTWPFFNAQFATAENSTGADHIELAQKNLNENLSKRSSLDMRDILRISNSSSSNLSKAERRLSLQVTPIGNSRDVQSTTGNVALKGYKMFLPGYYMYNFELPLDSHLPETADMELGSVKYELEAIVERSGAFRGNLIGSKEVSLIRTPAEGSLEQVEPIAIARNWDDQLHYDIVISGKSFPLGSQIPIAFKLTPLAKVQCHRIKVYVTEAAEYFCSNRRVHRMEPARRLLLFEKRAESAPVSTYPGSTMRVVSGGGIPYDLRAAAARGEEVQGDSHNLLGNLERGDGTVGPTELEISVQLPTCSAMNKDKHAKLHFDTTYHNIQVHHWIKVIGFLATRVND